jgi:hypothetical protein
VPGNIAKIGATALVVIVVTYISIVVGELVPKRLGQISPEPIARLVARPMQILALVTRPFVRLLTFSTKAILSLLGAKQNSSHGVTEEEIHAMLEEGSESGVIEQHQHEMVRNVFRLDDRQLGSLMIPRSEVVYLDVNEPLEENLRRVLESERSRFPVCRGSFDDVLGVLHSKQILGASLKGQKPDLAQNLYPCVYVPETLTGMELRAQLAITEVHSSQSTNGTPTLHADWFELTHYGTTPIDLRGWRLNDSNGGLTNGAVSLSALTLSPGESVVFVQDIDAAAFRAWWGPALSPSLQIISYTAASIGLSSTGDGVRLWDAAAASGASPAVSVDFAATGTNSSSFTSDPKTGLLTARTTSEVPGAFSATDNGDWGSPGIAGPSIPLSITTPPANTTVNPGDPATFTLEVAGLPRPRYQWRFNGTPIPGETGPSLTVSNAQPQSSGLYSVQLDNGLASLTSTDARLQIAAAPSAPRWVQTPSELTVLIGGVATFSATASGVPEPAYQWSFNGKTISQKFLGESLIWNFCNI